MCVYLRMRDSDQWPIAFTTQKKKPKMGVSIQQGGIQEDGEKNPSIQ